MNKVEEVLTVAKEILESEVGWCQGKLHEYEYGDFNDETKIISACAIGAIELAAERVLPNYTWEDRMTIVMEAENRMIDLVPYTTVADFNDAIDTTKEDVLLVFKKAIG